MDYVHYYILLCKSCSEKDLMWLKLIVPMSPEQIRLNYLTTIPLGSVVPGNGYVISLCQKGYYRQSLTTSLL